MRLSSDRSLPSKIFLVGFMGSGKTTLGRKLAERLGFNFVDLDELIEKKTGLRIPVIFESKGEKFFREIETQALKETVLAPGKTVISCGGGVVERDENLKLLRRGFVIYLCISFEEFKKRLPLLKPTRPLLQKELGEIKKLYERRLERYEKACDLKVNAEKNPDKLVEEVLCLLKQKFQTKSDF